MSTCKAVGNATRQRASATQWRAAAVMVANPESPPRAARARAQAPAPQRGVVSASHRRPLCTPAAAPCGSFPPASQTLSAHHGRQPSKRASALFPNLGGLTMAKPAPSFFYDKLKSVPLGGFHHSSIENSKSECKPLNSRSYTLCEVSHGDRQFFPVGFRPRTPEISPDSYGSSTAVVPAGPDRMGRMHHAHVGPIRLQSGFSWTSTLAGMHKHPYQDPGPAATAREDVRCCPRCGATGVVRVPRRAVDRLLGLFMSLRRYRCTHVECGWEGNLRHKPRQAP